MTTDRRAIWMSLCAATSGSLVGRRGYRYSCRYRLTNEVETLEGLRTGSGVLKSRAFVKEVARTRGEIAVLPRELPMVARFREITDPSSVEAVALNDLTASFGPKSEASRCIAQDNK